MNILLLYDGYRSMSDRTRIGAIQKIQEWCGLRAYGPREHKLNPDIAPIQYNETFTGSMLKEKFNPDVILLIIYAGAAVCSWYPKDICNVGVPVVAIDENHWSVDSEVTDMYLNLGVHFLVRRHFYLQEEQVPIPSVWWPFSACDETFFPEEGIIRKNEIVFCGSAGAIDGYAVRRKAMQTLEKENMLTNAGNHVPQYTDLYKQFAGGLTCAGSAYHTPMAKAFEIILSGSALLTNSMYNDSELFGSNKCYFEYDNDCNNIIEQANIILKDKDEVAEVTQNAMNIVKERHTDRLRAKELYAILHAIVSGIEIPRIWGQ